MPTPEHPIPDAGREIPAATGKVKADDRGPKKPGELFFRVFHVSPIPVLVVDAVTTKILEANEQFCALTGRRHEDLVGRTTRELQMWVDPAQRDQLYAEIAAQGAVHRREARIRDHTGSIREGRFSGETVELDGRACIVSAFEDLTDLLRAEAALRESEERFSKAFYASPDPYIIADFHTSAMLDVNDAYCRLFGVTRREAIGKRNSDLGLWENLAQRDLFVERLQRDGVVLEMEQHRRNRAGGTVICRVTAFRVDIGNRACTLYRIRDITRERLSEQALRESEEKFSKAFHATPDSMSINLLDDGRFLEVNDAFTRIHGWTREEAIGRSSVELGLWADPADRVRIVARLRSGGTVVNAAVMMRDKAGATHECLFSAEMIDLSSRACLFCLVRDVTEQRRLEDRLRQAQKMESIGQLAGGIAHDFNNILTVIQGHTSFLLDDGALPPAARDSVREIQQGASLAANLTRQLLLFSRRQVLQRGRLSANAVVGRTRELLHRVITENVQLEARLAPDLPDILADSSMVEQVLLNLAVNAQDAMPRGGRITLATHRLDAGADYLRRVPQAREGRFVGIAVSDTGEGIPPEILPRIFDPFFTTKEEGKGTGLGLATVYGIMEQHGGWVEVESQPGQGARFTVYFPVADKGGSAAPLPAPAAPADPRGHETILVVEDKAEVRSVLHSVLKRYGYQVVLAGDGAEALACWREHRARIALLFTDVIMPGSLTGRDLAEQLRADRPDLKVVFCSGYDADVLDAAALQAKGTRFITKPFDVARLVEVVRDLLDAE